MVMFLMGFVLPDLLIPRNSGVSNEVIVMHLKIHRAGPISKEMATAAILGHRLGFAKRICKKSGFLWTKYLRIVPIDTRNPEFLRHI